MEGVMDRMNRWEEWGKKVNLNINTNAGKITLIENDFQTLVNDIKVVDGRVNTNAQLMNQVTDELKGVKAGFGAVTQEYLRLDAYRTDINSVRDFIGINNFNTLDDVMVALGYQKATLSPDQIASMGFMNFNNIHHYDFDQARFTSWMGRRGLSEFAANLGVTLSEHHARIKTWEDWIHLYERDSPGREARLVNVEGKVGGLEGFTGKNNYATLEDYIGALGFTKLIDSVSGVLDANVIAGWGFITTEDFPGMNLGSAQMTRPDGDFLSINDAIGLLDSGMVDLDGKIGDRLKESDLLDTILSDYGGTLREKLTALGLDLGKLPGMAQCLQGGDSKFKGLIESMEAKFTEISAKLNKIKEDFEAFPDSLESLISTADGHLTFGISVRSAFHCMRKEFKALVSGGKSTVANQWDGVPAIHGNHTYEGLKPSFNAVNTSFGDITASLGKMRECGGTNLKW